MKLYFTNYRQFTSESELTGIIEKQINCLAPDMFKEIPEDVIELVDVVDGSNTVLYQLYFWDYGAASLFNDGMTDKIGWACQHALDDCEDLEVWAALGEAYKKAKPKIQQFIDFSIDDEDYYSFACYYSRENNLEAALKHLKMAIEANPKNKENAKNHVDFNNIRATEEFKKLVE